MTFLALLRPKHWIKNLFIFIPLLVSGNLFNEILLVPIFYGFIAFCLTSSSIYVFNDILDKKSDSKHPTKKNRPIASGQINILNAIVVIFLLLICLLLITEKLNSLSILMLITYGFINIIYTLVTKEYAILDVISISLGFVIRVQIGVFIADLDTSAWLLILTFCLSMLLALGKRKAELNLNLNNNTRSSLEIYNKEFLSALELVFLTSTLIFYVMYTFFSETFPGNLSLFSFSSIFVVLGLSRYMFINKSKNLDYMHDPVEILYKDKYILFSVVFWVIYLYLCISIA